MPFWSPVAFQRKGAPDSEPCSRKVMLRNCSCHGRSSLDGDELAAVYEVEALRLGVRSLRRGGGGC